jgi:hypothetical protein
MGHVLEFTYQRECTLSQRGHLQSQQRIIIILGEFFNFPLTPCELDKIALSSLGREQQTANSFDASCRGDFLCVRRT